MRKLVQDLNEIAVLERPVPLVYKEEVFPAYLPHGQILTDGSGRRGSYEHHSILLALACPNKQAPLCRAPLLNQQMQGFARPQARIGQNQYEYPQGGRAMLEHCSKLVHGGN